MQLTWLGTAGFKVDTHEGATILIDPYLSHSEKAGSPLSVQLTDLLPVDEILLTNGRFDHASDTPALSAQTGAIVNAPELVCHNLARMGIPSHSLHKITLQKTYKIGSSIWQALPSRFNQAESSPVLRVLIRDTLALPQIQALDNRWPLGETVAYHLQIDGLTLVHFGSTAWFESEIETLQPDIALLPLESDPSFSNTTTQLVSLLEPKVVIPHHWDDYYPFVGSTVNPAAFAESVHTVAPQVKVYIPTIAERFNPRDLLR